MLKGLTERDILHFTADNVSKMPKKLLIEEKVHLDCHHSHSVTRMLGVLDSVQIGKVAFLNENNT